MDLALGTVQFGLGYGVSGPMEAVPSNQARSILKRAHELGIRTLDTAAAYGDIEERLSAMCRGLDFKYVSKIPPLPAGASATDRVRWAIAQAEQSRQRLGEQLEVIMLHKARDLMDESGPSVWAALHGWGHRHGVTIGVSCYSPSTAAKLQQELGVKIAQVPGNALDQRLQEESADSPWPCIHLRSVFLQGLLLMDPSDAAEKVPHSIAALRRWHAWCQEHDMPPLVAALAIVKSFKKVSTCLVGVKNIEQLEEIAHAWHTSRPQAAPELRCHEPMVIDPRLWRKS